MVDTDILMGPTLATFIIGIITFILLYWYSKNSLNYWKEKNIRTVKSYPFVGSLFQQFTRPLHEVELERYKEFGKLYGHYEGNTPLLSIAEPALLRAIFVKDFQHFSSRRPFDMGEKISAKMLFVVNGDDWKRIRTILTPTFTTGKIKRMQSIFKDCSRTLVDNFKAMSKKGPIEMKSIYSAFTMDIIASSAFSTKLDSHNDPENEFVKTAKNLFSRSFNWRLILFFVAPKFMKFFKISVFTPSVLNFFRDVTLQIIEERKRTGQTRNDFLQLLMDIAKEVAEENKTETDSKDSEDLAANYSEEGMNHHVFKSVTKKNLDMDELVAQCVNFFLAGYDTTSSTLSFATYSLALNPDVQEKAFEEVCRALEETKGELTYEAIQSMKYIDNIISETLRLFPPVMRLERQCDVDYKLGGTGLTIPKGMMVTFPNYAMQRDPDYFPDPEKFDPDRFIPEERAKRDPYVYLPFGAGPRNCVGMRFALMEVKTCFIHVITNFKIKKSSKTQVPLQYLVGQGLLQAKEILLDLELRKDNPLKK